MTFKLAEKTTCTQLGGQMFQLFSAKVLMLLNSSALNAESFAALLKQEGISDVSLLREGFLKECAKHRLSINEAEYLFASTKRMIENKLRLL